MPSPRGMTGGTRSLVQRYHRRLAAVRWRPARAVDRRGRLWNGALARRARRSRRRGGAPGGRTGLFAIDARVGARRCASGAAGAGDGRAPAVGRCRFRSHLLRARAASLLRSAGVHRRVPPRPQARRRLLTIGLDPHHGADRWWIYEFFPAAWLRIGDDIRRRQRFARGSTGQVFAARSPKWCSPSRWR